MTDSLYQQLTELDEFITAIPEDISPQEYLNEFNDIMDKLEIKIDSCVGYLDFCKGRLAELSEKQKRLNTALNSYNSKITNMEQYLINCVHKSTEKELKSKNVVVKVKKCPPALKTTFKPQQKSYKEVDPVLLPLEMKPYIVEKTIYLMNTADLKNAIKADKHFESARLAQKEIITIRNI